MSNNTMNYDKISKKCCGGIKGLRLYPRRFSVQRLRTKFLYIFGLFRRWRNSYRNALRSLRRNLRKRERERDYVSSSSNINGVYYNNSNNYVYRSMTHSNSFCSEAIADCLEFIKRNSVSVDDERNPMLKQQ
ncbi:hypothetical protein BUALT_Bualt04G0034200 [Buddleja alternifolia]|uniref:Uncharacterized protein n=1 Tax=Buddleja alternifolia TaxID=168488 RepID=A0AAV6XU27_9LAMI|nr:hypothetical protein BUALT_Bualt04G0034200 [Buddleja alternifolia]